MSLRVGAFSAKKDDRRQLRKQGTKTGELQRGGAERMGKARTPKSLESYAETLKK